MVDECRNVARRTAPEIRVRFRRVGCVPYPRQYVKFSARLRAGTQRPPASDHKAKLISVSHAQANPTVLNDEKRTQQAVRTLQSAVGGDSVKLLYGQAPFFNDDFAYLQKRIPGVYFFLGGSNFEKGMIAMNHAPNFHADEESIRFGVKSFSTLMLDRLGAQVGPAASR